MSFQHSFCVCCLGRQVEDLQLPFLCDYGRQFSVDAATTADVNVKCNHSPRTTEEEVRMWEFIMRVKGKDQTPRSTYLSHSVSAEKVDILSFSVVLDLLGGCQTAPWQILYWCWAISSAVFSYFSLMWRLIFTLKAQRSHVTQLPGPQPSVYITTCRG